MLYLVEAWSSITKTEMDMLERLQGKVLCSLLEVPKTTPYWGLLNETGIWSVKWRLAYRKLMLYQNIMQSNDGRLAKEIIEQQRGEKGSFYEEAENLAKELNVVDICNATKGEIKTRIKEGS